MVIKLTFCDVHWRPIISCVILHCLLLFSTLVIVICYTLLDVYGLLVPEILCTIAYSFFS